MKRALITAAVFLMSINIFAAGGVGPDFLRIAPPAKTASLSGAFCGARGDVNSLLFNPAGLIHVRKPVISLTHFASFVDTNYEYLAGAYPLKNGTIGLGVLVDYTYDFIEYDEFGDEAGEVENYEMLFIGGYSHMILPWLYVGGNAKFFYSKLYEYDKMGGCVDAGILFKLGSNPDTYAGFAIQNLGFQEAYISVPDTMPVNIKGGLGTSFDVTQYGRVTLCLDVNRLWIKDEMPTLDAGIETLLYKTFQVRAGYGIRHDVATFTVGLGVVLDKVKFSYAFQPFGDLGDTHRMSLDIEL